MILNNSGTNVLDSANTGASSSFNIRASSHAFRLLSSGLYSDKIRAVLREIGCNAADAHIEAGIRDVPFEVKLPTRLDPLFYIKDFGNGLDDKNIRELYSTYFASTKQSSNEFTGAFGLGSKSPFSYTDSFTITSVFSGVKRVYTAHFDENGMPALTLMSEAPAEEAWPHGISIMFPVSPQDFEEFHSKARDVYRNFQPMPNILGLDEKLKPVSFAIVGSSFSFLHTDNDTETRATVKMGNVVYPLRYSDINVSQIEEFVEAETAYANHWSGAPPCQLYEIVRRLISMGIQLHLPIGAVLVTAAREQLDYDPASRKTLASSLLTACRELAGYLRNLVENETQTIWERRLNARGFATKLVNSNSFEKEYIQGLFKFADVEQTGIEYFTESILSAPDGLGTALVKAQYIGEAEGRMKSAWCKTVFAGFYGDSRRPQLGVNVFSAIVVADKPYSAAFVKNAASKGQFKTAILLSATKKNQQALESAVAELQTHFGGIPVIKSSELESVAIQKQTRAPRVAGSVAPKKHSIRNDFRLVTVFPLLSNGNKEKLAIAEVPESSRYYVISEQESTRRGKRDYYRSSVGYNSYVLDSDDFAGAKQALNAAIEGGLDGVCELSIEGYVVVTTKEYVKFKLADYGFKPLLDSINNEIESDETQAHFASILKNLPSSGFQTSAASALVAAIRADSVMGQLARQQLSGTAVGALMVSEAANLLPDRTPAQNLLFDFMDTWRNKMSSRIQKTVKLLDAAVECTNIDKLAEATIPAWFEVYNDAAYNWRNRNNKQLSDAMAHVVKALLTPVDRLTKVNGATGESLLKVA